MTLGRKGSKEKLGVDREIRLGRGEGHREGSRKREMSLAKCPVWVGMKGPSQGSSFCLSGEGVPT